MTELFDQQITDGLHRAAEGVPAPKGSFHDVRRRVRARRARHVTAVSLPAVAGLALVGLRQTPQANPLSPAAAPDSSTASIDTGPDADVTSTTEPTTTSIGGSAITPQLVAGVLCIDATGQADASRNECVGYLPDARRMKAPAAMVSTDTPRFVVPLDESFLAEAQTLTDQFGIAVRSDLRAYVLENLAGTDLTGVQVIMVIGTTDVTTCTVPGCDTTVTSAPFNEAFADEVARSAAVFQALGFAAPYVIAHGDDEVQLRALDPDNPDARYVTLTIGRAAPQEQATSTTIGIQTRTGSTSAAMWHGPWTFELEVVDAFGGPLPTGDELIALLNTAFGGGMG